MTPPLTERFDRALLLASRWHANQTRKGSGTPYIAHLLGVASLALEFGATEDEAIAALLHDALEDGPDNTGRPPDALAAEIEGAFGAAVLRIVRGCTDAEPLPGETKAPWAERKRAYLDRLPGKDASTLLVAGADKLYNARAILLDLLTEDVGPAVFDRFSGGRDGTLWYYRSLADGLAARAAEPGGSRGLRALARELGRTVELLEGAASAGEGKTEG